MTLRLYSERDLAADNYVPLLQAIWGQLREDPADPMSGRFARFLRDGASLFVESTLASADFAVLPFDYNKVLNSSVPSSVAEEFFARVSKTGKKTIVFLWYDFDEPVRGPDLVVLRTGFENRLTRKNEFVYPCWSEDFVERYCDGLLPVRRWQEKPIVGFCGRADPKVSSQFEALTDRARALKQRLFSKRMAYPYRQLRAKCMSLLSKDPRVQTQFMVNGGFWGRCVDTSRAVSVDEKRDARERFVSNMIGSDYVLCARGAGNFSIRFYETLCCGRVPLLIDTGTRLPFEHVIDWDRYVVRVKPGDLGKLPEKVLSFHYRNKGSLYCRLQREIRQVWEDSVEPAGFFRQLHRELFSEAKSHS